MEYPNLEKALKDKALLFDEIKMWLRVGLYISSEPRRVLNGRQDSYIEVVTILDSMANKADIDATMGKNIRMSIMRWWQVERVKPRSQEVSDNTGLGDLENRQNA